MASIFEKISSRVTNMWHKVFVRQFDSADELFFCKQFMAQRSVALAEVACKVGVYSNFVAMCVAAVVAHELSRGILLVGHGLIAALCTWAIVSGHHHKIGLMRIFPAMLLVPAMMYAFILKKFVGAGIEDHLLLTATAYVTVNSFGILLYPGGDAVRAAMVVVMVTSGYWAMLGHQVGVAWGTINAFTSVGVYFFSHWLDRRHWLLSRREYKLLIQAAPAKIVRQSISTNSALSDTFSPKKRHCVCISSDWRGYQKLAEKITPERLTSALGTYYELCNGLLSKYFPDGNFYTDWIADEFFVVIFANEAGEEKTLVNQVLYFTWDLILEKKKFAIQFGVPDAIDIGVSSGIAMIGMMGPTGHKKATALGDVPGRARRYQAMGKLLRAKKGDLDRVIFGSDCLMEISVPLDIQEFKVDDSMELRDLEHNSLFFMEPNHESYLALRRDDGSGPRSVPAA